MLSNYAAIFRYWSERYEYLPEQSKADWTSTTPLQGGGGARPRAQERKIAWRGRGIFVPLVIESD